MAPTQPTSAKTKVFWACTEFNTEEVLYTWTIHNFKFCKEDPGKSIESQVIKTDNGREWTLSLFPRGETVNEKDYISIFVNLIHSSEGLSLIELPVKYKFTLLDAKQNPVVHNLSYKNDYSYATFRYVGDGYGRARFIKRDDLIKFLAEDPLIISCELTICGDKIDTSGQSSSTSCQNILPIPACTLSDDLGSSFSDPNAGDTILEVDGKEFFVYKGILQVRSPVFAAMFQHEMKEQIQNRVIIPDFEPKVVEEMLTYIYTGKSPNVQVMANDLLSIADKYNLQRLKMMSADVLLRELTNENAIVTLTLAELYRVNELKTCVINFITANSPYFMDDAVWENIVLSLSSKHPSLIVEMSKALFASKK